MADLSLFTSAATLPFGVAAALILAIALLEGIGLLIALSPSHLVDQWLPHLDGDGGVDRLLDWLHIGRVPSLVLLLLFLTGFALSGYAVQMIVRGATGAYLPAWIASLVAVPPALFGVRALGAVFGRLVPRDESSAVSEQALIGRFGVVSAGAARRGMAAQARVRDSHGHLHHVMVEPSDEREVFDEGAEILLVRKVGAFYHCIANPHPGLL